MKEFLSGPKLTTLISSCRVVKSHLVSCQTGALENFNPCSASPSPRWHPSRRPRPSPRSGSFPPLLSAPRLSSSLGTWCPCPWASSASSPLAPQRGRPSSRSGTKSTLEYEPPPIQSFRGWLTSCHSGLEVNSFWMGSRSLCRAAVTAGLSWSTVSSEG